MNQEEILVNRILTIPIKVNNKDYTKEELIKEIQNSFHYMIEHLNDNFYRKSFVYRIGEYYEVSNTVMCYLVTDNIDTDYICKDDEFIVNNKKD